MHVVCGVVVRCLLSLFLVACCLFVVCLLLSCCMLVVGCCLFVVVGRVSFVDCCLLFVVY